MSVNYLKYVWKTKRGFNPLLHIFWAFAKKWTKKEPHECKALYNIKVKFQIIGLLLNIEGTDIQIKMFDDHLTIESPGIFAGTVKDTNLRNNHFSRNPKIMEFLKVFDFVKEFGEGVDRMYKEMESANLPEPEYKQRDSMVYATIKNKDYGKISASDKANDKVNDKVNLSDNAIKVYESITKNPKITRADLAEAINKSEATINRAIRELKDNNLLEEKNSDKNGAWGIIK